MTIAAYIGSMDHSPSEQLGAPDDWHTTVLILSEAGQHDDAEWRFKLAAAMEG